MTVTTVSPARGVLTDCVLSATAAPSLHNSQPWLFRVRGSAVDVYADADRRLPVLDPDGREHLISVGAAVFTLRLALRRAGFLSDMTLFPVPDQPDLVARVNVTHHSPVTPGVEKLAAAIPHRHTNRQPFAQTPVPPDVLDHLRGAARKEGAALAVAGPAAREAILGMAWSADRWLRGRPGYRHELARWTTRRLLGDGVPEWAGGPWDALEAVPIRDFAQMSPASRPSERFGAPPAVMGLATTGDRLADWVRAGQALQRVLLEATWRDLATTPISQPIEVPALRRLLIEPGSGLSVQMVLRIGYGRQAGRTPRRPLADVLLPSRRDPVRGARPGS